MSLVVPAVLVALVVLVVPAVLVSPAVPVVLVLVIDSYDQQYQQY